MQPPQARASTESGGDRYDLSTGLHGPVYESPVRSKRSLAPRLGHRIGFLPRLRRLLAQRSSTPHAASPSPPPPGPAPPTPSPLSAIKGRTVLISSSLCSCRLL